MGRLINNPCGREGPGVWDQPNRALLQILMREHLFSYGIFKKGQPLHKWLYAHCEPVLVGPAVAQGCVLVDVGGFPGMKSGSGRVFGEVWALPWSTIEELCAQVYKDPKHSYQIKTLEVVVGSQTFGAMAFFFENFKDHPRAIKVVRNGIWK